MILSSSSSLTFLHASLTNSPSFFSHFMPCSPLLCVPLHYLINTFSHFSHLITWVRLLWVFLSLISALQWLFSIFFTKSSCPNSGWLSSLLVYLTPFPFVLISLLVPHSLMHVAIVTAWDLGESAQQHPSCIICLGKVMALPTSLSKPAGTAFPASLIGESLLTISHSSFSSFWPLCCGFIFYSSSFLPSASSKCEGVCTSSIFRLPSCFIHFSSFLWSPSVFSSSHVSSQLTRIPSSILTILL